MNSPVSPKRLRASAALVGGVILAMLALALSARPLYSMFCEATGYGGATRADGRAPDRVLAREIEVRFDTNVAPGLPLEFTARERPRPAKLGESALTFFTVRNLSDKPLPVVATYNVTPHKTGIYFQKLECFCFQDQVLQPGQSLELPVVFFIDPALAEDRDVEEVAQITLSYTFFPGKNNAVKTADSALAAGRVVARP